MTINQSTLIGNNGGTDKLPRVEILLCKNPKKVKNVSPLFNTKSPGEGNTKNSLDETKSNLDKNSAVPKDLFESKNYINNFY
jgi:hypothetical protein